MMHRAAPGFSVAWALVAYLAILALQRGFELALSVRNARRARARGAREHGRSHFPAIVLLHVFFPLALVMEVILLGARPTPLAALWLALWLAAQALRYWAMRALGESWNVRIWVRPGAARVTTGPYRFLRHPNYVAVAVELCAAPLFFGAWRTAFLVSVLNLMALRVRIREEERAWAQSGRAPTAGASLPEPAAGTGEPGAPPPSRAKTTEIPLASGRSGKASSHSWPAAGTGTLT